MKISVVYYEEPAAISVSYPVAVLYVNYGEGNLMVDGVRTVAIVPHRVFLVNQSARILVLEGMLSGYLLEFTILILEHFLIESIAQRNIGIFNRKEPLPHVDVLASAVHFLKSLLVQIIGELEQQSPLAAVEQYLFLLLTHVNRQAEQIAIDNDNALKVAMIAGAIDIHFRKERKTLFYAELLGISERALNELAKQLFSKRFGEILLDRICHEAEKRLVDLQIPIKMIAWDLGYESDGHFNTVYTRHRGFSPAAFREASISNL